MFPSIPMSLPRYVPAGGRAIDGIWLPAGTIVSCQPYTMHRFDEAVFPRPDTFDPERWLGADVEADAEMNRRFFAFSNHVAHQYPKLTASMFQREDIVKIAADFFVLPRRLYPPIQQGAAVLKNSREAAAAQKLLAFLLSAPVQSQLAKSGLTPAGK